MAENINKGKGTIFKKRKNMSAAEYVDFLLQSNTPLEVIEEIIKEKEIKSNEKVQELQRNNSTEELRIEERKLRGYKAVLKEIKCRKETKIQENDILNSIERIKKTYEETIEKTVNLCGLIDELNVSEIKDYSSIINKINSKIKECTQQFGIQYDINMEIYKKVSDLREITPEYDVFEKYAKLVPTFEGKEREYVKEQCISAMKKIKEIQELNTREKTPILYERKEQQKLKKAIELHIDEVLPKMLTNPKDFEFIKAEAIKEVGLEVKQPNIDDVPPVLTTDDGATKGNNTPTTGTNSDNTNTSEGPVITTPTEPPKSAIDNVGTPKFNEAKQQYINAVLLINNRMAEIEEYSRKQSLYAATPSESYGLMIEIENRVLANERTIENIKQTMRELEYQKFVEDNIVLSLDEDIAKLPRKELSYDDDLDVFVASHNSVIEACYAELQAISSQPDYKENEAARKRANLLLEVISVQHSIINRRLLHEKKMNKDFDMIGYLRTHPVNSKNPVVSSKIAGSPVNFETKESDESAIIADIDNKLLSYKQHITALARTRYNMLSTMGGFVDMAEQSISLGDQMVDFNEAIENLIENSNLSEDMKKAKFEEYKSIEVSVEKEIKEECVKESGIDYEFDIIELNRKLAELKIISNKLVDMSAKTEEIEMYKAAKERFLLLAKEIKEEFKEYGIKFTVDSLTNNIVVSIPDKKNPKGRSNFSFGTLTKEQEKKVVKATTIDIKEAKLNFNRKVQKTRKENIIETTTPLKVSLLKNSIKVSYTKKMLEELKNMKLKLEIVAGAANDGKINVTEGKDSKDGLKEYRYISNPTDLTEAKIVYKDIETEQEVMSMDILNNEEIAEVIAERRKLR